MGIVLDDAVTAANTLLGYKLVHESPQGRTAGYIVETEAYTMDDPASHTFHGKTARNSAMFAQAGTIYVYFTYGMHYCMNIACGPAETGQGVLIRAIEPIEGIELMQVRRRISNPMLLTNGPAKLTQAMGVNINHNNMHISKGPVLLEPGFAPRQVVRSNRIGVTKATDKPWRFYIAGNPYVSKTTLSRRSL